jgi:hypothetical protein
MASVASCVLSLTIGRMRFIHSSRAAAGLFFCFSLIGSARMSRSAASIAGASAYCSFSYCKRRAWRISWLASFVLPCRSAFLWSHCARMMLHSRLTSFLAQIVPE